jgi:short-subunit dehydrogenase
MGSALVTGASSGIGLEIAKRLSTLGYRVYGVGRDFAKCKDAISFTRIIYDLKDTKNLNEILHKIDTKNLTVLVNCAGFGSFGPHECISTKDIEEMILVNLTTPMLLTKLLLRDLRQNRGYIFNINSISGIKSASFGAVYGATKAALRHFGKSIFEENRKQGLKVININPDITKTNFFNNLDFSYSDDGESYIEPKSIADIVGNVLLTKDASVITDITIEPQKFQIRKLKKESNQR